MTEERDAAYWFKFSGLEQVEALARGDYPTSPMTQFMPFATLPPRKGHLQFEATPSDAHLNGFHVVHGGWAMTMLDNAMGLAAHSTVGPYEICPSIETSVSFKDKIEADGRALTIIADVIRQDGPIALSSIVIAQPPWTT